MTGTTFEHVAENVMAFQPVVHDGCSWKMTQTAFDAFLARLNPDRERAGEIYQQLRTTVVRYLSSPGRDADRWADEVMDRAVRKNQEQHIENVHAFVFGVAKRIRIEMQRRRRREVPIEDLSILPAATTVSPEDRIEEQARMACLKECCDELSPSDREFLVSWYSHSGSDRIAQRRRLATSMGVAGVTLRVRAFRTREVLRGIAAKHGLRAATCH